MSVQPVNGSGAPRAIVECDVCASRTESVACDYSRRSGGDWEPNIGQIKKKMVQLGWAEIKGKIVCPSCKKKRKVEPMTPKTATVEPDEPTKKQRLEIISMLIEVYDIEGERYTNGDTDNTVANTLGVMPGWVAEIREAEFGPDGGNEDIEAVKSSLDELEREIKADVQEGGRIVKQAQQFQDKAAKRLATVASMRVEIDKIRKAVGQHVVKRAGV